MSISPSMILIACVVIMTICVYMALVNIVRYKKFSKKGFIIPFVIGLAMLACMVSVIFFNSRKNAIIRSYINSGYDIYLENSLINLDIDTNFNNDYIVQIDTEHSKIMLSERF